MPNRRWSLQFTSEKKVVTLYENGNNNIDDGHKLNIETNWSFSDLIKAASTRINMHPPAKIVYSSDGVAINDCMMIQDNDIIFLSDGSPFINPVKTRQLSIATSSSGSAHIPKSIGGYHVGKFLGKGAFGEVHFGEHQMTGERVALKFLRKSDILRDLESLEQVSKEIHCLKALRHRSIIRLQQHFDSAQHVVLVFELMEGGDLLSYMLQHKKMEPSILSEEERVALSDDEARLVFVQVVNGISYAHNQHICHRDLKLENILLKEATLDVVKIGDFGLSDFYRPGTTAKSEVGTLAFLAPEVFRGTANSGPPLDVWALGVVLFTMLCGRLPFDGEEPAARRSSGGRRHSDVVIKEKVMKAHHRPIGDHVNADAKDLLRRIFKVDPAERISVPEILVHTWLRAGSHHHHSSTLSDKLPSDGTGDALTTRPLSYTLLTPLTHASGRRSPDSLSKVGSEDSAARITPTGSMMQLPAITTPSSLGQRSISFGSSFAEAESPPLHSLSRLEEEDHDIDEVNVEDFASSLPKLEPIRRSSLNSKILQKLYSPSLDFPKDELPPKSVSSKESPSRPMNSKTVLTRLNRNTKPPPQFADVVSDVMSSTLGWLSTIKEPSMRGIEQSPSKDEVDPAPTAKQDAKIMKAYSSGCKPSLPKTSKTPIHHNSSSGSALPRANSGLGNTQHRLVKESSSKGHLTGAEGM